MLLFGTVPFHGNCETRALCAMQRPLTHRDGVPQPLVHAFTVAARYRGERRFKVLFEQRQTRRPGQVNRPRQIETPSVSILLASFR